MTWVSVGYAALGEVLGGRCHHSDGERHPSLVLLICFVPLTTLPAIARQLCRRTPAEKRSPCWGGHLFPKTVWRAEGYGSMEERLPSTHKALGSVLGSILELRKGAGYKGEEPGT